MAPKSEVTWAMEPNRPLLAQFMTLSPICAQSIEDSPARKSGGMMLRTKGMLSSCLVASGAMRMRVMMALTSCGMTSTPTKTAITIMHRTVTRSESVRFMVPSPCSPGNRPSKKRRGMLTT